MNGVRNFFLELILRCVVSSNLNLVDLTDKYLINPFNEPWLPLFVPEMLK